MHDVIVCDVTGQVTCMESYQSDHLVLVSLSGLNYLGYTNQAGDNKSFQELDSTNNGERRDVLFLYINFTQIDGI